MDVANHVLRDLVQFGLIKEDDKGHVRAHLSRLYVAGWELGYRNGYESFRKTKTVVLYDKRGKVIKEYPSAVEAAMKNQISPFAIYSAIRRKSHSRNGNYWKWKKETPPLQEGQY